MSFQTNVTFSNPCKSKEDVLHPGCVCFSGDPCHESIIEAANGKTILQVFRSKTSVI